MASIETGSLFTFANYIVGKINALTRDCDHEGLYWFTLQRISPFFFSSEESEEYRVSPALISYTLKIKWKPE